MSTRRPSLACQASLCRVRCQQDILWNHDAQAYRGKQGNTANTFRVPRHTEETQNTAVQTVQYAEQDRQTLQEERTAGAIVTRTAVLLYAYQENTAALLYSYKALLYDYSSLLYDSAVIIQQFALCAHKTEHICIMCE